MKKTLIFKILYLFLVLIVVAGASVFATNTYLASQISYGSTNVEDALNGLFKLKENTYNYSTDEQIIGKWINGKPIYRKYLEPSSLKVDDNVDKIVDIKIYFNYSGEQEIANPCYTNGNFRCMGYYVENTHSISIINSSDAIVQYLFVEYTKTID